MTLEPLERAGPGVLRLGLAVRVTLVVVKGVAGVGIENDVGFDRRLPNRLAQLLDVLDRDRLVLFAEQAQPWRLERGRLADEGRELWEALGDDAPTVEADGGAQPATERGEERDPAT